MLAHLPNVLWLIASAGIAVWILLPRSKAGRGLRLSAALVLAILAAEAGLWTLDLTFVHVIAAFAGGTLAIAAVVSRPGAPAQDTVAAPPEAKPEPTLGTPQEIASAIGRWTEAAAIADGRGVLTWANDAWAKGHRAAGPVVGKSWSDFHPAREGTRWQWLIEQALREGQASGMLEHRSSADGGDDAETWTSRAHLIALDSGKRLFVAAIRVSEDEATLRREAREIGHNLNNVLSAVVGNVGLAIETPGIDPTLQADLREAEEGALRAAELIHGLQALARGEAEE